MKQTGVKLRWVNLGKFLGVINIQFSFNEMELICYEHLVKIVSSNMVKQIKGVTL